MPRVTPRHQHEHFESMHNRFKRAVEKGGVLEDFYRHEFYEKPCAKRKRRKAAAVKRAQREEAMRNSNRPIS